MKDFAIITLVILSLMIIFSVDARRQCESCVVEEWCNANGGEQEFKLKTEVGGRVYVDCVLDDEKKAIEFDFGNKWHQCIGQSLYYGYKTNYSPVCVLIKKEWYSDKTWHNYVSIFKTTNKEMVDDKIELICVNEVGAEIKC